MKVKRTSEIGFCYGVQRAIKILKQATKERGEIDALGALVHNEKVTADLNTLGIRIVDKPEEIRRPVVAISAHGVTPQVEADLQHRANEVIDTTCPSVKRVQKLAQKLAKDGFFVVIFGEAKHPEVKGILGWAQSNGMATLDILQLASIDNLPKKIGVLSQTTQIPENFVRFTKDLLDRYLADDREIRIIDTICHGVRNRQSTALALARDVDIILVVGGRNSANSRRLQELCSTVTQSYLINDVGDIKKEWLEDKESIGVTSGTSASKENIDEIIKYIEEIRD